MTSVDMQCVDGSSVVIQRTHTWKPASFEFDVVMNLSSHFGETWRIGFSRCQETTGRTWWLCWSLGAGAQIDAVGDWLSSTGKIIDLCIMRLHELTLMRKYAPWLKLYVKEVVSQKGFPNINAIWPLTLFMWICLPLRCSYFFCYKTLKVDTYIWKFSMFYIRK